MLFTLTFILSLLILLGLVLQCLPIHLITRRIANRDSDELSDEECPPVAVMLSLRGGDPYLGECLRRLIQQDYPDYHLFIALDNEMDPAHECLKELIAEHRPQHLTVRIITDRPQKSTLVNHNYGRMVKELDARFQYIAFVDADAVAPPTWLKTLVRPLVRNPDMGGTSGNRWYAPEKVSLGSLTRSFWNMGSLVQMALFHYPWGGSMAMRADIAKSDEMLAKWGSSFTTDTPTFQVIKSMGKKYCFNSDVILINREETTLSSFLSWMPRQMLNGRLYHPAWPPVVIQAFFSTFLLFTSLVVNFVNLFTGQWLNFLVLGGPLMLFWITLFVQFLHLNATILARRSEGDLPWLSLMTGVKLFLTIPLVQFVYGFGVFKALQIRDVTWRGIDYVIDSPFDIRLVAYKPFDQDKTLDQTHSL